MKLTSKASLAFKLEKTAAKPTFGSSVIAALSASIQFPNLPVNIAQLQTINDALSAAISAALTGNHTAVAAVKNAVADWNNAFTLTANYVTTIAKGDEAIIRSGGFVPTKSETTPKPKPGGAVGFKVTINGTKGAIIAGAKSSVPFASGYLYAAVPDGVTIDYNGDTMVITVADKTIYINADTRRQTEFFNLPSGVAYNVTMFAFNTAGNGPAAASQKVIAQ